MTENDDNLVPIDKFKWTDDYSYHRHITCVNHQTLRWSTKNWWARSVFFHGNVNDTGAPRVRECECPAEDLRVVVDESQPPVCCPWGTKPERTACEPDKLCDKHWDEYWLHCARDTEEYRYWAGKRSDYWLQKREERREHQD